jgi:hypothetical protein
MAGATKTMRGAEDLRSRGRKAGPISFSLSNIWRLTFTGTLRQSAFSYVLQSPFKHTNPLPKIFKNIHPGCDDDFFCVESAGFWSVSWGVWMRSLRAVVNDVVKHTRPWRTVNCLFDFSVQFHAHARSQEVNITTLKVLPILHVDWCTFLTCGENSLSHRRIN